MQPVHPVILCGGSGTRLWPLSRKNHPKQFLRLLGDGTLFQATLQRVSGDGFAAPLIVTGEDMAAAVEQQMSELSVAAAGLLVEPAGKGTAAAIAAAARVLEDAHGPCLMLAVPSDHFIRDAGAFRVAVLAGVEAAQSGAIVTFGVTPRRAETGYGYIARADGSFRVERFIEKPDRAAAEAMLAGREHLWNAGLFLSRTDVLLQDLEKHAPAVAEAVQAAVRRSHSDHGRIHLEASSWSHAPHISFDHAVMEKTCNAQVVPLAGDWSDIGSWNEMLEQVSCGQGGEAPQDNVTAIACDDTFLHSDDPAMELVGIGLTGVIAVATRDAVLVADKSHAQQVRLVVERLHAKGKRQADTCPRTITPWGSSESFHAPRGSRIKLVTLAAGRRLPAARQAALSLTCIVQCGHVDVHSNGRTQRLAAGESARFARDVEFVLGNAGDGQAQVLLVEIDGDDGEIPGQVV